MQELAMKFSPDDDIQNVLAISSTDAQPKAGSETLSLRAQKRVRREALCIVFFVSNRIFISEQIAKQARLKEKRKKIKEKKATAIANANAKNATNTVGIGSKAGDTSDMDGENHSSKRSKVTSKDPPGGAKYVHQTSVQVQAKGRRTLTDAGRNIRKESTKAPISEKRKRGRRLGEKTTPAH